MTRTNRLTPEQVMGLANEAAAVSGLDPAIHYGMFMQESGGDPNAVSWAGAQGLAQFMPATAKQYGLTDPFDPRASALASARYMRDLTRTFGGDVHKAIMAYNAGPGNIRRGRIPKETAAYLPAVLKFANAAPGGSGGYTPAASREPGEAQPGFNTSANYHNPFLNNPFAGREHLMPEPEFGLPFTGPDGQKQRAVPETEDEAERLARWAKMDEDIRGRLLDLEQKLKPKEPTRSPFQTYPNDFDEQLLEIIDRV